MAAKRISSLLSRSFTTSAPSLFSTVMEKYFKRKAETELSPPPPPKKKDSCSKAQSNREVDLANLPVDPGLRTQISDYNPNEQDQIRRAYLQRLPCQPRGYNFPQKPLSGVLRRFNPSWFDEFSNWLEYSIEKDAAFCLCCFLFKQDIGGQSSGDVFVGKGFSNWKKKQRLYTHVGGPNSAHNSAVLMCQNLMNPKQHIQTIISKQSDQAKRDYRTRLNASIDCIRFLLRQGLPFRGHDESEDSSNRGNFLEMLKFLADHVEEVNAVVLKNAPENHKMTSPDIQKDIINSIAVETINAIIRDVGDSLFSILIDESRDVSRKEQMAIALRYVERNGRVVERFVGIAHVTLSLKTAIEEFFSKHGLSISSLRGQGYDGASNMRGEFNSLKALIMKENECAYYVHCFAHQLQLALVGLAKHHNQIGAQFNIVANIVNVVGASCRRRDMLREKHAALITHALEKGELPTGRGLNQETSLVRFGDTRWGSHYGTLASLIILFTSVIEVLEEIEVNGSECEHKIEASVLLDSIQAFEFVFNLHLMKNVLGITNELSQALQKKDQDIVNAMALVKISKQRLQMMRESGWDSLLYQVCSFCGKHDIVVPNMDDIFLARGRPRRNVQEITNLHYYRVDIFYAVIDVQLRELNNRFTEASTELLLCLACLEPNDSFSAFDKQKLIRLAEFYPEEFSAVELMILDNQLETYIIDVRSNSEFLELKGIGDLAQKMVKTKKDTIYPLVYLLVTLALILPVATATVERAFSGMKIMKTELRNRMGDQFMNDALVVYIEKDIFDSIDNEVIIQRFQNMKTRRGQL